MLIAVLCLAFAAGCGGEDSTEPDQVEAPPEATRADAGPRASDRPDKKADERADDRRRGETEPVNQQQVEPTPAVEQQADAAQEAENKQAGVKKQQAPLSPQANKQKQAEDRKPAPKPRRYEVAYDYCAEHSPRELSREYGGRPDDYASVAEAYAAETATERSQQAAYTGCYDALVEEWG